MFWRRKDKIEKGDIGQIKRGSSSSGQDLFYPQLRSQVLAWKDRHTAKVEMHLMRELITLKSAIDVKLESLSLLDGTIKVRKITKEIVHPLYEEWLNRESSYLIKQAQAELLSIRDFAIEQVGNMEEIEGVGSSNYIFDVFSATTLGVIGLATIPAVTSSAVVSAGGLLGLFGVTTLNLPLLVTGLGIATIFISVGGMRMSGVKRRAIERYRKKLHKAIDKTVFGDVEDNTHSLCGQLQNVIEQACNEILREIR